MKKLIVRLITRISPYLVVLMAIIVSVGASALGIWFVLWMIKKVFFI